MSEDPAERARSYLEATRKTLKLVEKTDDAGIVKIVDHAKRYIADCKYFLDAGRPTTALASIAYAEGLLDSLNILGLAVAQDSLNRTDT